jgi:hypothetical protein
MKGGIMWQFSRFIRAMKRAVAVALIASLALMPVIGIAAPGPTSSCENIAGTLQGFAIPVIENNNLVGFEVVATNITGPLSGQMMADVVIEKMTPGGTIHFGGTHFFTGTQFGDFQTDDSGVVTPSGRVNTHLVITDGPSGFIKGHGAIDAATGEVDLRYHGQVCTY